MKKVWTALLAVLLVVPLLFQSQAQAAVNITVLIDGTKVASNQAPIMIQGRVMLPMRAIFESLGASVKWNQKTQTVTASRNGTTIVLRINANTATINGQTVSLDVPAKNLKGTTMVPVRFASEALGEKIGWNSRTKTVTITTSPPAPPQTNYIAAPTNVTIQDIGNAGDGRDIQVSFTKSSTESQVSHYRILIVKQSKSINLAAARQVPMGGFTAVYPNGSNVTQVLSSGARDTDGELIRDNEAYRAYVLAFGNSGNAALSTPSQALTLTNSNAVQPATNVRVSDVSDYNDGRDLSVSFTRAQNESNILNYRIMVVKTKDIGSFNLAAAKNVSGQNYTSVNKTSSTSTTLTANLSSSARDTSGELIRNGIPYTVFVMSVSTNENAVSNQLSAASSSITLASGATTAPIITQVADISDYGDGRDLRVTFNKVSNESNISAYRIFVVKESDHPYFSLSRANSITNSSNYTQVGKTNSGSNITTTLSSNARDVDGALLRNGVNYRVFVMAVSNSGSGSNVLSPVSNPIVLVYNTGSVGAVSGLYVNDVGNSNDGRDLQVSFTRPSDESNISHYRVFVVKASDNSTFDLYRASNINSNYTNINKTGGNTITSTLLASSRDIDGALIQNGVSYRVYVMSVAYSGNHALSYPSSTITLTSSQTISPVSTPVVSDTSDNGNGTDMRVSFNPTTNEMYISHYRVYVVKSNKSLTLSQAINNNNYKYVDKRGGPITINLDAASNDTDGERIRNEVGYRVYVMSVANSNTTGGNALSASSNVITLKGNTQVAAVTNVQASDVDNRGDASDLSVSFTRAANDSNIQEYRIMVVKQAKAAGFNLSQANAVQAGRYDTASAGNNFSNVLRPTHVDVDGEAIRNLVDYQVFVLSVSKDGNANNNALSQPSGVVRLTGTTVGVPTDVYAGIEGTSGNASDIRVRFTPAPNPGTVQEYRIMVVPETKPFGLAEATAVASGNYIKLDPPAGEYSATLDANAKDVDGNVITAGQSYRVFVLVIADGKVSTNHEISKSSSVFTVPDPVQVTNVKAELTQDPNPLKISFTKAIDERNVEAYHILLVAKEDLKDFDLKKATEAGTQLDSELKIKPDGKDVAVQLKFADKDDTATDAIKKDALGKDIKKGTEYAVFVLSSAKKGNTKLSSTAVAANPLSKPSKSLVIVP